MYLVCQNIVNDVNNESINYCDTLKLIKLVILLLLSLNEVVKPYGTFPFEYE